MKRSVEGRDREHGVLLRKFQDNWAPGANSVRGNAAGPTIDHRAKHSAGQIAPC